MERDRGVDVVVLRGSGFCSGHDLAEDAEDDFETICDYRDHCIWQQREFTAAWRISTPVIASVRHYSIGKGFGLALFPDITIVTEDTRLGHGEIRYGIAAMAGLHEGGQRPHPHRQGLVTEAVAPERRP